MMILSSLVFVCVRAMKPVVPRGYYHNNPRIGRCRLPEVDRPTSRRRLGGNKLHKHSHNKFWKLLTKDESWGYPMMCTFLESAAKGIGIYICQWTKTKEYTNADGSTGTQILKCCDKFCFMKSDNDPKKGKYSNSFKVRKLMFKVSSIAPTSWADPSKNKSIPNENLATDKTEYSGSKLYFYLTIIPKKKVWGNNTTHRSILVGAFFEATTQLGSKKETFYQFSPDRAGFATCREILNRAPKKAIIPFPETHKKLNGFLEYAKMANNGRAKDFTWKMSTDDMEEILKQTKHVVSG